MDATNALRLMAVCLAAAMICAVLRAQRQELAMAFSLAAGAAVLGALALSLEGMRAQWEALWSSMLSGDRPLGSAVVQAVGIAVCAELGSQVCEDAGERAMAGRILLISRVALLALCLPLIGEVFEGLSRLLS